MNGTSANVSGFVLVKEVGGAPRPGPRHPDAKGNNLLILLSPVHKIEVCAACLQGLTES